MAAKRLRLRRPDTCTGCGIELAVGVVASWDRDSRTVTCIPCLDGPAAPMEVNAHPSPVDDGRPGASLAREYERRRSTRERRVREAHPHIGGLLLAWNGEPQHQKAFRQGEQGEIDGAASIDSEHRAALGASLTAALHPA